MHQAYVDFVLASAQGAVNNAARVRAVRHAGLRGDLREIFTAELLRPLLPPNIGLASGEVIDAQGRTSSQQDVVMFDRSILPPALARDRGIVPIESTIYSIQVKSSLTLRELRSAHANAMSLAPLTYLSGQYGPDGQPVQHRLTPVVSAVFAFQNAVSTARASIVDRYDELRGADQSAVRVFCVVGSGYWYRNSSDTSWITAPHDYDLHEVVGFIGGVMNTISEVAASRGRPRLGNYFLTF